MVPIHGRLRSSREAFVWGYGHYLVFASAAAIGAGLEVAVEQTVGKAHISTLSASAGVTLPTALHLLTVRALHSRHFKGGIAQQLVLQTAALLVICCTFLRGGPRGGRRVGVAVVTGTTLTARMAARGREAQAGTPTA
ncbi:low temperature requirement protein A [Streptomyces sp. TRM70350]|nr:low temperature requirement protein A [Streptomyces sp. TRM70350]